MRFILWLNIWSTLESVSNTPGNILKVFSCVECSGIAIGLWFCPSLLCPTSSVIVLSVVESWCGALSCYFSVLSHASGLPGFIANVQKMFIA